LFRYTQIAILTFTNISYNYTLFLVDTTLLYVLVSYSINSKNVTGLFTMCVCSVCTHVWAHH